MRFILILALLIASGGVSQAGSSNCSSPVAHITASGGYSAQSSDCMISVEKSFFEFTQVVLPAFPSLDDEFTISDNSTAEPSCEEFEGQMYCYSAGIGVRSVDSNVLVDGVQNNTIFGVGQVMRVIFDGSNWQAQYSR
jgi:hypothetical protein